MSGAASDQSIIGNSKPILELMALLPMVSLSDATVLITGESGVGKDLIAEQIHRLSARRDGPLITLNCATIPSGLFESTFFGHVRGAFSGATRARTGRFAAAHRGTLFLDDVAEIPIEIQSKLLRAVQNGQFERLGDDTVRRADTRLIAATNRNLETEVVNGRFRPDLYYRLSVVPLDIPPLRDRLDDVPLLAQHIIKTTATAQRRKPPALTEASIRKLRAHAWPGNVRELRNVIERAMILSNGDVLELDLEAARPTPAVAPKTFLLAEAGARRGFLTDAELRAFERENMVGALEASNWVVAGANGAAAMLGIKPTTLASRVKSLAIRQPEPDALYNQLGRRAGILALVREIASRVMADDVLQRFWAERSNLSLLREEQLLVSYLADKSGGPIAYSGRSLIESHETLGITDADWDRFKQHVDDALGALRLKKHLRDQVGTFLGSLKDQIAFPAHSKQ